MFQFIWCVVAVFAYVLGFFSWYPTDGYHGDISPIFEILFFSLVWPVFIVIAEAADYFIGGRKYDWLIAVPVMVALCLVILLGMRPSDADKYRAFQSHAIDWGLGCFFGGLRYQARLSTGVSLAGSEASAIMHQPRSAFS